MTNKDSEARIKNLKSSLEKFRARLETERDKIIQEFSQVPNSYRKAPFEYKAPMATIAKRLGPTGEFLLAKAEFDYFAQTLIQLKALADPKLGRLISIQKSPKTLDMITRLRRRTRRN